MQETDSLLQVAEGIYQVQIPLPFALRIVNCYLLDNGDASWTVVDTGLNLPDAQAIWNAAFEALDIAPRHISQIILTHTHPDHFGMAGWLQVLSGAPVRLSPREFQAVQEFWVNFDSREQATTEQMEHMAVPAEVNEQIISGIAAIRAITYPHPTHYEQIAPGDPVLMGGRSFQSILAPGHSDGQLVFYDSADRLMLSGDQVLMKITPNIGLWPETDPHPLGRFMDSLVALHKLDVRLALPGHKELITNWPLRINELVGHHLERLGRVVDILDSPKTAYQVAQQLFHFDRLTVHEMRFAVIETLAHLDYLVASGVVQQSGEAIWHFEKSPSVPANEPLLDMRPHRPRLPNE